jgi:hypothetical protein
MPALFRTCRADAVVHAGIVFPASEAPLMSTSSNPSERLSAQTAGHDATRGVLNAVIAGAALWSATIAVLNWALG